MPATGGVRRRIAIVGAGWAGLAALARLSRAGHDVTVYEAAHTVGGRARRVDPPEGFDAPLDNGQHLMLGAYRETLALMRTLEPAARPALLRLPLTLRSADGRLRLRAPRWPSPWHTAGALLGARGLTLADKVAALRLMFALRRRDWRTPAGRSVADLLDAHRQPSGLTALLWRPLCLAALNTPPAEACAQLFATVLRDALAAGSDACDLLLPTTDLTTLWPDAAARLGTLRRGHAVRGLAPAGSGVSIDGEPFDAAILAVPPHAAARLLTTLPAGHPARPADLLDALAAFDHAPIATLTLRLAAPYRLAAPMLMLHDDPARGHDGQWVFDRGQLLALPPDHGELAIVVSAAAGAASRGRDAATALLLDQLREQLAAGGAPALPPVRAHAWIMEKRATFVARPGLRRPANATGSPALVLAGDWTDTGYPATLEGAVRSGNDAARHLLASRAGCVPACPAIPSSTETAL